ncbi:glycoside hydrolase family 20 zincin-like fold domain-containing protein [Clostridium sp.]|uniref:beta-N-acetylhexosaminidase n=1 Tax=Clostridium sp. TaxID=1506 RepID=UPI002616C56D|nr:glycoside hydrolase family 20 zincin-like fold domain-containing protein [Clostridium sp.]
MYLIPRPKEYREKEGYFKLKRETKINLSYACNFYELDCAIELQKEIKDNFGLKLAISKNINNTALKNSINIIKIDGMENEEYKLIINNDSIEIIATFDSGIFYAIQTLKQVLKQSSNSIRSLEIEDKPYFKNRGFFHDTTRGKVPTLETLKQLVDKASFYKINQIQLYIEHTFAFKGMSEVWIDKDPLTSEEILILDMYCKKRNVELIPSLSTFGHLYEVLRTKSFCNLCEMDGMEEDEYSFYERMAHHTLDVSNEESLKLVENMLEQFIPLFTSKKFNICGDETFDLGKGKSKAKADKIGEGKLYVDFLNKVISIVKKYDKTVMFWGDVILRHTDLLNEVPDDLICLNWDYSNEVTEEKTRIMSEVKREQYVSPGVGSWNQLVSYMDKAFENIRRMINYGVKYNAAGVLNTDWGDFGHINLLASSMPGMIYGAALSWNPNDETSNNLEGDFTQIYKAISRIEYGDKSLKVVSLLNDLTKNHEIRWEEVVAFKERYGTLKGKLETFDVEYLENEYKMACKVEDELISLLKDIENKYDIQELVIATEGMGLFNKFFITVMKYDLGKESSKLIYEPKKLAEDIEVWFYDYSRVWRMRNKESELYRIREVIQYICKYLRGV